MTRRKATAAVHKNGWWFQNCPYSNLNGIYYKKETGTSTGLTCYSWENGDKWESLKASKMMIKPK